MDATTGVRELHQSVKPSAPFLAGLAFLLGVALAASAKETAE